MKEKHFLFLKTSSLGDILHTIPSALWVKKQNPDADISWVVEEEYVSLMQEFSAIDQIIGIPWRAFRKKQCSLQKIISSLQILRKKRYDVSIDFQGNTKSGIFHFCSRARRKIGIESPPEYLNRWTNHCRFPLSGSNIQTRYLSLLSQAMDWELPNELPILDRGVERNGRLLVAPFSRWDSKMVPFRRLEKVLNIPFDIICGSEKEASFLHGFFLEASNIYIKPTYAEWISLTKKASGVLGVDSAQLHLASLFGIPTFSLFGPTSKKWYAPLGNMHKSIQGICPLGVSFIGRCPYLRRCENKGCSKQIASFAEDFVSWASTKILE